MRGVPEPFAHERDSAVFRALPAFPEVELYEAHIIHHSFAPHTHQAFGIGGIIEGREMFRYRGERHLAGAGSLVTMNPDELHTGQAACERGWRYRMAYLDEALLARLSGHRDVMFSDVVRFNLSLTHRVVALIGALWQSDNELEQSGLLMALAESLQPILRHAPPPGALTRFHAVRDYLHDHYMDPVNLAELAGLSGLSRWHFLRQFKAHFHVTPHQMLMAIRLWRARQQLARGVPAALVAAAVGLSDQAHLTRAFNCRYGTTPARYQKQVSRAI